MISARVPSRRQTTNPALSAPNEENMAEQSNNNSMFYPVYNQVTPSAPSEITIENHALNQTANNTSLRYPHFITESGTPTAMESERTSLLMEKNAIESAKHCLSHCLKKIILNYNPRSILAIYANWLRKNFDLENNFTEILSINSSPIAEFVRAKIQQTYPTLSPTKREEIIDHVLNAPINSIQLPFIQNDFHKIIQEKKKKKQNHY